MGGEGGHMGGGVRESTSPKIEPKSSPSLLDGSLAGF